jgi:hypothetical protein
MSIDVGFVYWVTQGGGLKGVPKAGGVTNDLAWEGTPSAGIAIDDQNAYWTAGQKICRTPLTGGACSVLATGVGPLRVATNSIEVFWSESGSIKKAPVSGSSESILAQNLISDARGLAVDGSHLYFAVNACPAGGIYRVSIDGGPQQTLAESEQCPDRIALDASHVYYVTGLGGELRRVLKTGGGVETLATGATHPVAVAVDNGMVYWTDKTSVRRTPCGGGATEVLADGQALPNAIAMDAQHVFWTTFDDSSVWRKPK